MSAHGTGGEPPSGGWPSPGLIDTPMLASMKGQVRDRMVAAIAAAAAFLASGEAGYINGVVLDVDGRPFGRHPTPVSVV